MGLNKAVYLNTLRWFSASPARLVAGLLFMALAYTVLGGGSQILVNGMDAAAFLSPGTLASWGDRVLWLLAWILGVGLVRREVQSGSLALLLTRPLTRLSYLLSKWAALATLLLVFVIFCHGTLLARGRVTFATPGESGLLLAQTVQVLALAALLVCFSSLPLALGEWGSLLALVVALIVLGYYGGTHGWTALTDIKGFSFRVLFPKVADPGTPGVFLPGASGVNVAGSIGFNLGIVAGALGLSWLALERREFGYAQS
ncbi:MAG: ABC transporter permease, partial [bacterium]